MAKDSQRLSKGFGPGKPSWTSRSRLFSSAGLKIPCFFIRAASVVRFIPNLTAAPYGPATTHPVASSAPTIRVRSDSLSVMLGGNKETVVPRLRHRGLGSEPSLDSITARSITFWSSRTFPGQEYDSQAFRSSSGMVAMSFLILREKISTKYSTRGRMSSRRSRRGGNVIGNTFSR